MKHAWTLAMALAVAAAGSGAGVAWAESLEAQVNKAFRRIGIGPEQSEAYSIAYEQFLLDRNMQVRRVLNSRAGEEVPVVARKRVRRAAKKSVKAMRGVLSEAQLSYYAEYLELANQLFLREAGLR